MRRVFLAFAFRDPDREIAARIEQLLASYDIVTTTGERLGGDQITPAVRGRIEAADGLIALLTRRDQIVGDGWTTHQWVREELQIAREVKKHAIALIESQVEVGGAYASHEWIPFDPANTLEAFVALAETIGTWKREAGRTIKVRIEPPEAARQLGQGNGGPQVMCRFVELGEYSGWRQVSVVREAGGTFVYVPGVRDEVSIQIAVLDGSRAIWLSPATSQWMQVELERQERGQ